MLRCAMRLQSEGYILITTLLILLVLTLLVVSSSESGILNQKMQNNWEQYLRVFQQAEWGWQQLVAGFEGEQMSPPNSPVLLTTAYTLVNIDACGNQTIDLQSTAKNSFSTVILNSRDIFARVPTRVGCGSIPLHQIVWWKES